MSTLFIADEFRRTFSESLVPFLMQSYQQKQKDEHERIKKRNSQIVEGTNLVRVNTSEEKNAEDEEFDEVALPEYEYFTDYLEMIIQYAYITLFATAFPLGSFFAMIFIYVESRSDLFKLSKLCRRPLAYNTHSIGIWDKIMTAISYTATFTNMYLFAFAPDSYEVIQKNAPIQVDCGNAY